MHHNTLLNFLKSPTTSTTRHHGATVFHSDIEDGAHMYRIVVNITCQQLLDGRRPPSRRVTTAWTEEDRAPHVDCPRTQERGHNGASILHEAKASIWKRVTNLLHTMDTAQTKPHRHKVPRPRGWPHTRSEHDSGPAFARFSTKAQCANNIFKLHSLALVCHARKLDVGVQPQFTSTDFLVCEQPFTVCGIGTSRQTRKR